MSWFASTPLLREPDRDARPLTHADLYRLLSTQDPSPSLLARAQTALECRLWLISESVACDSFRARRSEPARLLSSLQVDDGRFDAALDFLAPWLCGLGSELRHICQGGAIDQPANLLLFGIFDRCCAPGKWPEWSAANTIGHSTPVGAFRPNDVESEAVFEAAFLRLSLSYFPARRFAEILGYALAEIQGAGLIIELMQQMKGQKPFEFGCIAARAEAMKAERDAVCRALVSARCALSGKSRQVFNLRVRHGVALHTALTVQVLGALVRRQQGQADLTQAVAKVLGGKAPHAVGYHARVQIAGRCLDDWFAEQPLDASAFLGALASSSWVDRQNPGRSPLLRLMSFDGPMFGVFDAREVELVRDWLETCASPDASDQSSVTAIPTGCGSESSPCQGNFSDVQGASCEESGTGMASRGRESSDLSTSRKSVRSFFHALVNAESHPSVAAAAADHVNGLLRRGRLARLFRRSLVRYGESSFERWIGDVYRRQLAPPRRLPATPRLSREAYVFGIEQMAPAILVDGSWLQRSCSLAAVSAPVATRLFAIYSDELGNGDLTKNHAGIYRRLLESLQIQCAPIETLEFAASERFLDAAFDLPVLLLSIALNTHRYLPELLGLNLAIEVSGLGLGYSQLARDLDYWGIDPKIVRLHQSIDNFASGHAAIAREAIVLHLREVGALGGDSAQQANWRRVNRGYGLLNEATRRLKRSMVASFLARQALGRVRRSLLPANSL